MSYLPRFGPHKYTKANLDRREREQINEELLYRALNTGTVITFIGSGCSAAIGYKTWTGFTKEMVERTLLELTDAKQQGKLQPFVEENERRLGRFSDLLNSNVSSEQLPFFLTVCKKELERIGGQPLYEEKLGEIFEKWETKSSTIQSPPLSDQNNPYRSLLEIKSLRRFITSNYDNAFECLLAEHRKIDSGHLKLPSTNTVSLKEKVKLAFTQKDDDHLAIFALSHIEEAENMIFHCHGSIFEPSSMVVTEADYNNWYLAENDKCLAFRQTLDLLFGSNPILFVGFSLNDVDLLRPLRIFGMRGDEREPTRPIFAILPRMQESKEKDNDHFDHLFAQYKVRVIPYDIKDWGGQSEALCQKLEDINKRRGEWWRGWLTKPKIRKVSTTSGKASSGTPKAPYYHYAFHSTTEQVRLTERDNRILENLEEQIFNRLDPPSGKTLIPLIGPGGTGKSWYALRLMERLVKGNLNKPLEKQFAGFFFWSSYYSDDSLTGLDRALFYMEGEEKYKENRNNSRLNRLKSCLRNEDEKYFIVFDGVERFLHEGKQHEVGYEHTPRIKELFKILSDQGNKSIVLITSRLWPQALSSPDTSDLIRPFTPEELEVIEPFDKLDLSQDERSALCSLLDGHIYGLLLAGKIIARQRNKTYRDEEKGGGSPPEDTEFGSPPYDKIEPDPTLLDLKTALSRTPPDRRIQRMIREAIDYADRWVETSLSFKHGIVPSILERVAIFMSPVSQTILSWCIELSCKELGFPINPAEAKHLIEELKSRLILFETNQVEPDLSNETLYTIHPLVRGYIFQRVHHAMTDALPSFTLSGFTSGTALVDPGSERGIKIVQEVFNKLCDKAETIIANGDKREALKLCRGAFGVVRARMESNTVPRWYAYDPSLCYDTYLGMLARLIDLVRDASPSHWDYASRDDLVKTEDPEGILYADELAWLYNELGLGSYSQSSMLDALAVWEQQYEINRIIDRREEGGQYIFQSLCNLGASNIHLGRLEIAETYFKNAMRQNFSIKDKDHGGRITGYLALIHHLRGNLKEADKFYQKAIRKIEDGGTNNRGKSIFLRHYSDLLMTQKKMEKAEVVMQSSRALAEVDRYPDLTAYVRLSFGHWHRLKNNIPAALQEYNAALKEARQIGIRRLEAEVLTELARLFLSIGEFHLARQRAIESLMIANECVLGLRQTHGLLVLGKATVKAGQRELGIAYLKQAKRLAKRQQYWLRMQEAEEELQRLEGDS